MYSRVTARRRESESRLRMAAYRKFLRIKDFLFPFSGLFHKDILGFPPFVSISIMESRLLPKLIRELGKLENIFEYLPDLRLGAINFGWKLCLLLFLKARLAFTKGSFVCVFWNIQSEFKCSYCTSVNYKNNGMCWIIDLLELANKNYIVEFCQMLILMVVEIWLNVKFHTVLLLLC